MTDLGTLGGSYSYARGINSRGQVVGWSCHSFRGAACFSLVERVHDRPGNTGRIRMPWPTGSTTAGRWSVSVSTAAGYQHAFLWDRGVMTDLGTLGGDYIQHRGSISRAGCGSEQHCWRPDSRLSLGERGDDRPGNPGRTSQPCLGINDLGQIAGRSETSAGETHAVLWEDGSPIDLGTFGGPYSSAYGINNRGQVVGTASTATGWHTPFSGKTGS